MTLATQYNYNPTSTAVSGVLVTLFNTTHEEAERIGMALRRARKRYHGVRSSLTKAAEIAGVSVALLSMIERGDHAIQKVRPETLQRFPDAYGMTPQEFSDLTGIVLVRPVEELLPPTSLSAVLTEIKPGTGYHRVPVRGLAAAGVAFYGADNIIDTEYVPDELFRPNMMIIEILGHSMEPTLHPGDRVFVDIQLNERQHGKVYLVHIHGDGFVMKRAKKITETIWTLDSDNAAYDAISSDEGTIVGQAYHRQPRGNSL